ncbi:precorrin-4 C(11)-methyltransferase [Streptomyces sp. RKND-216]|uniref:precorrin-4 C(11)-methyltransferase n=1 Tax=Streptomyces sp. RKND-216 TaxID=2562581 RepID=UPI00109DA6FB|nr:precorrin-4 C(11)-methyltransferase [Streptomyces sp. RKND-216]THA25309.1 precorrin-4 C(11)-methyltransferase [Streptomyces sp. RKND-216]
MTVHFIGAGPGAADLITLRGALTLAACDVCLYAGSLVPRELLDECPPHARLVDTAQLDLDEITAEFVRAHEAGHDVARLHSGDPSVFSAVAEQMRRLDAAGVPYEVVPGVPAFAAAAAALRQELTVPTVGQTVILTRVAQRATAMPEGEDLATLGRSGALLVLHLAAAYADRVVEELLPHYGADCPAAVVALASRPDEVILRGTLADIADQVREAGVRRTAVILVGRTLAAENFRDSHLYSPARARHARAPEGGAGGPEAGADGPPPRMDAG